MLRMAGSCDSARPLSAMILLEEHHGQSGPERARGALPQPRREGRRLYEATSAGTCSKVRRRGGSTFSGDAHSPDAARRTAGTGDADLNEKRIITTMLFGA